MSLKIMDDERAYWLKMHETTNNRLLKRVAAQNLHWINTKIYKFGKLKKVIKNESNDSG